MPAFLNNHLPTYSRVNLLADVFISAFPAEMSDFPAEMSDDSC